ncbi:MAG: hypothetical protein WA876_01940 [Candidatus Acidiferrales bacterium]
MKSKALLWMVGVVGVLALAATASMAQFPLPRHLSGLINDYTPESGVGGPWEIRGVWSLDINDAGRAKFSAELNMEHSDLWVELNPTDAEGLATIDTPADRVPHTHHITMTDATVTYNPTDCPLPASITPIPRLEVKGTATVAANGGPFPPTGAVPSQLQVCIDGGTTVATVVPLANVTLAFGAPASGHFGAQAIHGVVRRAPSEDGWVDTQR